MDILAGGAVPCGSAVASQARGPRETRPDHDCCGRGHSPDISQPCRPRSRDRCASRGCARRRGPRSRTQAVPPPDVTRTTTPVDAEDGKGDDGRESKIDAMLRRLRDDRHDTRARREQSKKIRRRGTPWATAATRAPPRPQGAREKSTLVATPRRGRAPCRSLSRRPKDAAKRRGRGR